MVHALQISHGLLAPDGRLIDIHPRGEPSPITVRLGGEMYRVGWLDEVSDYVAFDQAQAALDTVVADGLFALEHQADFAYTVYADTTAELRHYVAENWTESRLDERLVSRADDLLHSVEPDKELILRELARIARLRPL